MPRLVHMALGAAAREIRRELKAGATWADAHLVGRGVSRADVLVDSSFGFSKKRHPKRRETSPAPATTIVVVATAGTEMP